MINTESLRKQHLLESIYNMVNGGRITEEKLSYESLNIIYDLLYAAANRDRNNINALSR